MKIGLIFSALGYLAGSIPFSYLAAKIVSSKDVRREGSGNVGVTNVFRVAGKKAGIAAALGDVAKSLLPVLAARLAGLEPAWVAATGGAVILGHCYPLFLGFSGGKGVASTITVFVVLYWPAAVVFAAAWLAFFLLTRRVSFASLVATASIPVTMAIGKPEPAYLIMATLAAVFIFYRHRGNIRRLLDGTEPRMGLK